jgi:O-antigen/teichoic acid export membrane protein
MTRKKSLLSDGAWLAGLQGFAALGQLVGVRLLTEILPPAVFGEFSLWLGVIVLAATGLANPTMQAMLRYYPEYALNGRGAIVMAVVSQQLLKLIKWTIPVFIIGATVALFFKWTGLITLGLLSALVAVEVVRMKYTTLLNSERHHRLSGIWAVAEAWGRPILAWAMVSMLGISIEIILVGFLLVSVCVFVGVRKFIVLQKNSTFSALEEADLAHRFWTYSLPLLPLGLVGWVSGMADRYMIGILLSPADVGLYVAIYGLASRPMLMFGAIIESVIRPVYLSALIEGDNNKANGYLKRWMLLIVLGSLLAIMLALVGHQWLADILLGAQYRSVSFLLPWIIGGYALLIISYIANRICYANGATKSIFIIEVTGAVIAIIVGFVFIKWGGLKGAAVAIPFYYGVQLAVAFQLARSWLKIR